MSDEYWDCPLCGGQMSAKKLNDLFVADALKLIERALKEGITIEELIARDKKQVCEEEEVYVNINKGSTTDVHTKSYVERGEEK